MGLKCARGPLRLRWIFGASELEKAERTVLRFREGQWASPSLIKIQKGVSSLSARRKGHEKIFQKRNASAFDGYFLVLVCRLRIGEEWQRAGKWIVFDECFSRRYRGKSRRTCDDDLADFKAANPDVTLEFKIESYSGNYSDKLISQASNGALPDLFFTLDSLVGYFASRRITVPLNESMAEYGVSTDDIYEEVLEVGKVGDEIHMLGREYSQVVLYYNQKVFDDAGVGYPTEDWTWEDMIAAGRKLAKKDTDGTVLQAGIDMQLNWPTTVMQYIEGNNGKIFNTDGSTGSFDANAREALLELRSLVDEGVILNTFANTGLSFMSGNIGMYFGVRSNANAVNRALPSWNVVHVPDMTKHVVSLGASGYSVSALSPHQDVALQFLFFIMGKGGQTILARSGNVVPALRSLADSPEWTAYPKAGLNYEAFLQEDGVTKVYPVSTYLANPSTANKLTDALNKQVLEPFLSSKNSVSDAVWKAYEDALTTSMR